MLSRLRSVPAPWLGRLHGLRLHGPVQRHRDREPVCVCAEYLAPSRTGQLDRGAGILHARVRHPLRPREGTETTDAPSQNPGLHGPVPQPSSLGRTVSLPSYSLLAGVREPGFRRSHPQLAPRRTWLKARLGSSQFSIHCEVCEGGGNLDWGVGCQIRWTESSTRVTECLASDGTAGIGGLSVRPCETNPRAQVGGQRVPFFITVP